MGKTITLRVDDSTYKKLKTAAESERRTISNFIENASLSYIDSSTFVDDEEMNNILSNKELLNELNNSMNDIKKGKYHLIR
jgi:uncharacterized protein (DUF1778 family)